MAPTISRNPRPSLPPRDGEDRLFLDVVLHRIDQRIGRDHMLGKLCVTIQHAWAASAICFSARPPISATLRVISCKSASKALRYGRILRAICHWVYLHALFGAHPKRR